MVEPTCNAAQGSERGALPSLAGLLGLALWLGVMGFGGGFAVARRIRQTVVDERRWMTEDAFLEHFAVASVLPGTAATNLLSLLGLHFRGPPGALGAAAAFLAPSVLLMLAFGAGYEHIRRIEALSAVLDGMSLSTVGVVGAVALDMGRAAIKTRLDKVLAAGVAVALSLRLLNLLEVVALAGLAGVIAGRASAPRDAHPPGSTDPGDETFPPASLRALALPALSLLGALPVWGTVLLVFARIGIATFGGGFAMIAPLEHEVVQARSWLSEPAFNDAMVLGQITPGPVAVSATFIGYRVDGLTGALAATAGMFGPPFLLAVAAGRSMQAFRTNSSVRGFLHGVSPAVVGIIAAACVSLSRTTVHGWLDAAIALGAFVLLVRWPNTSPLLALLAGGAVVWVLGVRP